MWGAIMLELDRDRADRQVRTVSLLILAVVALGAALHYLKPVLVPFLLAVFFTQCLTPVIDFQVRHLRAPRLLAILGAAVLGLAILGLCGLLVAASVGEIKAESFDAYRSDFDTFAKNSAERLHLDRLGIHRDLNTGRYFPISDDSIKDMLSSVLVGGWDLVSSGVLVVIFMTFILLGRKGDVPRSPGLLDDIEQSVRRYTLLMVALSALTGALVWFTLFLLNVPFAFLFGSLAFFLYII